MFVVSQTDYLAYGQAMPDRSFNTTAIRYTFNGKEDEIFSEWQDYGFRNYDKKQRRFTSVDPLAGSLVYLSPYSYAQNNPIAFIDMLGKIPKLAIILIAGKGNKEFEFDDHYNALKAAGYKVIKVYHGKELIEKLEANSTIDSPIKNLIILSHGSPGGLSDMQKGGVWTESELKLQAITEYVQTFDDEVIFPEYLASVEGQENPIIFENWKKEKFASDENVVTEAVTKFREEHPNLVLVGELTGKVSKSIHFADNKVFTAMIGGCNLAGALVPETGKLDGQNIFVQELAVGIDRDNVFGAVGKTGPSYDEKGTEKGTPYRKATYWMRFDSEGNSHKLGKQKINLLEPEKK